MNTQQVAANQEHVVHGTNGWFMLFLLLGLLVGDILVLASSTLHGMALVFAWILLRVLIILLTGCFTLQPNQARVLLLFGAYKGTVRESGLLG